MSKYVYGIDLGTTYSCIAYQDENGQPVVIKNSEGSNTTPSVISLAEDEPVVGQVAKENAVFDAAYTLSLVKNKIGRKDASGNPEMIYYGDNAEKEISPATASSYTLKKLAAEAGKAMDDEVKSVVITCPAYFDSERREQTKQAGIEAGLDVLAIIDEPTAAALCYGCSRDVEGQTFLVYDLGGGTFDITVMRVEGGKFKVVSTEGNHDLGGALWDQEIYGYLEEKYREQTGDEDDFEMDVLQDLTLKSEKAKQNLSGKDSTTVVVSTDNGKAKIEITRETFDDITSTLLEETITLTKKAIAVAQGFVMDEATGKERSLDEVVAVFDEKFRPSEIDQILLVGGSTRMPQVEAKVKEVFSGLKVLQFDPDEAVAKGAAIYASLANDDLPDTPTDSTTNTIGGAPAADDTGAQGEVHQKATLSTRPANIGNTIGGKKTDIIETRAVRSYGVVITRYDNEYPDGHECINNLIIRETVLPCDVTETYSLSSDAQSSIWFKLCETPSRERYSEVEQQFIILDKEYDIPQNLSASTPVDLQMSLSKDGMISYKIIIAGHIVEDTQKVDMEKK